MTNTLKGVEFGALLCLGGPVLKTSAFFGVNNGICIRGEMIAYMSAIALVRELSSSGADLANLGRFVMVFSSEPWGVAGDPPKYGFDADKGIGSFHHLVLDLISYHANSDKAVVSICPGCITARVCGLPQLYPDTVSVAIFDLQLVDMIGVPTFQVVEKSRVLQFPKLTPGDFFNVISTCSGMGVGTSALSMMEVQVKVANDVNPKMAECHQGMHPEVPFVTGSIGDPAVIQMIHNKHPRSAILFAGFSCQPYSSGGAKQGAYDTRSEVLQETLFAAYMLRSLTVILECVRDAGSNRYVRLQVETFCRCLGFSLSEVVLTLDSCWCSKRDRWWAVLSLSFLGRVCLPGLPVLPPCLVKHVLPRPLTLIEADLEQLRLTEDELRRFCQFVPSLASMFLKGCSTAPTALHSWTSQTSACPCDCRSNGFSDESLSSKGLYGVLMPLEGSVELDGKTLPCVRHIHPTEVALLNAVPLPDAWPTNLRLAVAGLGQMAVPLHVNWVFSHFLVQVYKTHVGSSCVCPNTLLRIH